MFKYWKFAQRTKIALVMIVGLVLALIIVVEAGMFKNKDHFLGRFSAKYFNHNSIEVIPERGLQKEYVTITSYDGNKTYIKNGKQVASIKNRISGDQFKIYYEERLIGHAGIYKTKWWHVHDFKFHIQKLGKNEVQCKLEVEGIDKETCFYFKEFVDDM